MYYPLLQGFWNLRRNLMNSTHSQWHHLCLSLRRSTMTARMVHIMWSVESRTMMKTCWCVHDVILFVCLFVFFLHICLCSLFKKLGRKSSMCFICFRDCFYVFCFLSLPVKKLEITNLKCNWRCVDGSMHGEWLRSSVFGFPFSEGLNMFRKWKLLAPTKKTQTQKATGLC